MKGFENSHCCTKRKQKKMKKKKHCCTNKKETNDEQNQKKEKKTKKTNTNNIKKMIRFFYPSPSFKSFLLLRFFVRMCSRGKKPAGPSPQPPAPAQKELRRPHLGVAVDVGEP